MKQRNISWLALVPASMLGLAAALAVAGCAATATGERHDEVTAMELDVQESGGEVSRYHTLEQPEPPPPAVEVPQTAFKWSDRVIYNDVTWSGDVLVRQPVAVGKTGSLTIKPGTRVYVDVTPGEKDGFVFLVNGKVAADGTADAPVEFIAVRPMSENGRFDLFSILEAREARFAGSSFTGFGWAIHLHDTPAATLKNNSFIGNYGGVRFKSDSLTMEGNLFERNKIGIRCLNSFGLTLRGNSFIANRTGVFLREGVVSAELRGNNFDNDEYDIKLGEAQSFDVDAKGNWWASLKRGEFADKVYDAGDWEGLGRVNADPALRTKVKETQ